MAGRTTTTVWVLCRKLNIFTCPAWERTPLPRPYIQGLWSNSSSGRFIAGTHCTDGWQDHHDSLGTVPKGQHIYLSSLGTNSTPSALHTAQTKMCLALSPRSVYTFKAEIIKQGGNFSFNSSEALHPSKQANN